MKKIPDTSQWKPRQDASETLKDIFYKSCLHSEKMIIAKAANEEWLNIDNYDSGLSLEDIVREEIGKLLPDRYFVTAGIVNDRNGLTSGDHDLIVYNKIWFPFLKQGATTSSRRYHFPIDGIYAIGEIKQTLSLDSLDAAMKKLVISQRLERPKTVRTRIVENREIEGCKHGLTNPLYTFILAKNIDKSLPIDELFSRFFEINKTLNRNEIVRAICVLQEATITWAYYDSSAKEIKPATFFQDDLLQPIFPVLISVDDKIETSMYSFIINLSSHLYNSILGAEDLAVAYGNFAHIIKVPPQDKFLIR